MSGVSRFEDLVAWQKARKLAARIHRIVSTGPFARDFAFRNQIWRAALSIPSNISEGFERFNPAEFAHFLSIAKASCGEVRSDLYIALDVGHIDEKTLMEALAQANDCARVITRLRRYVQSRVRNPPRRKVEPRTEN